MLSVKITRTIQQLWLAKDNQSFVLTPDDYILSLGSLKSQGFITTPEREQLEVLLVDFIESNERSTAASTENCTFTHAYNALFNKVIPTLATINRSLPKFWKEFLEYVQHWEGSNETV